MDVLEEPIDHPAPEQMSHILLETLECLLQIRDLALGSDQLNLFTNIFSRAHDYMRLHDIQNVEGTRISRLSKLQMRFQCAATYVANIRSYEQDPHTRSRTECITINNRGSVNETELPSSAKESTRTITKSQPHASSLRKEGYDDLHSDHSRDASLDILQLREESSLCTKSGKISNSKTTVDRSDSEGQCDTILVSSTKAHAHNSKKRKVIHGTHSGEAPQCTTESAFVSSHAQDPTCPQQGNSRNLEQNSETDVIEPDRQHSILNVSNVCHLDESAQGRSPPIKRPRIIATGLSSEKANPQNPPLTPTDAIASNAKMKMKGDILDKTMTSKKRRKLSIAVPTLPRGSARPVPSHFEELHIQIPVVSSQTLADLVKTQSDFYNSLLESNCSTNTISAHEALEITYLLFHETISVAGFHRLIKIVEDYQGHDTVSLDQPLLISSIKAQRLSKDATLPRQFKTFFHAYHEAVELDMACTSNGISAVQMQRVIRNIDLIKRFDDIVNLEDRKLDEFLSNKGFLRARGKRLRSVTIDYLAQELGISRVMFKNKCHYYRPLSTIVHKFGKGIIPLLPENAGSMAYKWGQGKVETALSLLDNLSINLKQPLQQIESLVLRPFREGRRIVLAPNAKTIEGPVFDRVTQAIQPSALSAVDMR